MSNRSKRAKQFAVLGGSALVAAPMFGGGVADAATIEVTNLNDSGAGSLREAIETADGDAAADTITFAAGLTGTITLTSQLEINSAMSIVGPGATSVAIDGGSGRVLYLYASDATAVTVSGLTLRDGNETYGAGIRLGGDIDLTLDSVKLSDNTATLYGGGVYMLDFSSLTVVDSEISGNSGTYGGAVYQESAANGPVVIRGSLLSDNYADNEGGALYIAEADALTIEDSRFINNASGAMGGAIAVNETPVTITDSTFSGNTALYGGALYLGPSYDGITISGSTFVSNSALYTGGAIHFGGVYDGDVSIKNSTFSGNTALYGGGIYVIGFYEETSYFTISHSTITLNSATGTDVNYNGGGGIYLSNSGWNDAGIIRLEHTVLSGNSSVLPGDDISYLYGGFTGKWSMIGNLDGFTLGGTDNLPEGNANLGALADNGGPTLTHMPLAGSPLINAGNPAFVTPPTEDQRGYSRVGGGRIDVGAVESDAGSPTIPETGSSSGTLALIGAALLAVGGALRLTDRRRTRQL